MELAIGLVVDDAIVVIENVEHHMEEGLSLAVVFVLVAFMSGMTGILYRQFALIIAFSMALSAFVALSLTPALCAMILKPRDPNESKGLLGRFFAWFNDWFNRTRRGYMSIVAKFIGHAKLAIVFMIIVCGLMSMFYKILPSTFVPEEDQGYFMTSISLPEGSSLNRTIETMDKIAHAAQESIPGIKSTNVVAGFDILSFGLKSSAGMLVCGMDPWDERPGDELSVNNAIKIMFGIGARVAPEAQVIAFNPPTLPGLGMVGGWSMQLQDMTGHTDEELNEIMQQIVMLGNQRPELQGVRSTFRINSKSVIYDIDRDKVKNNGIVLRDVFDALQVNFGGFEVNDFNQFGRTYKVVLQSDVNYRSEVESSRFVFVRGTGGAMVPLDTLITPRFSTTSPSIMRFNATKSINIQGNVAEGYSSGQAMAAIEEVARSVAPVGFNVEWSDQSREEKKAGDKSMQILALSIVFVFLCLAALYESWSIPYAVLLTVPTGIMGALACEYGLSMFEAMFGHQNAGLANSIYMQIGIIMIIGLAAKNAILIVEFAKVRTDRGMTPVKAAVQAAGLRLRPILMTSFAFIIGCLPLAVATGAGAAARNGMGVAVVGGMLFATSLGIFLIPVFYVIVEWVAAKLGRKRERKHTATDYM